MTDLLAQAETPWIRYSSANRCSLAIAHSMLGTKPPNNRDYFSLALRRGVALEPMINQWLTDHGFALWFTGNEQLQVHAQDPFRGGHPDGFISVLNPDDLTWWARHHVPEVALNMMLEGQLLLSEVKTMNSESFSEFKRHGLDGNSMFFPNYKAQIQGYLNTIYNQENDELWDSERFRALLKSYNYNRPRFCLVTAYAPADNEFAFSLVEINETQFKLNGERLFRDVIMPLRQGVMPEPSYDGKHPDCYFCPFADLCPSVIARRAEAPPVVFTEDAPLTIGMTEEEVNETIAQLIDISSEIKSLERKSNELRDRLISNLIPGIPFVTSRFYVKPVQVTRKGGIDLEALNDLAARYGFEIPYRAASSYIRLYKKALFGSTFDTEVS